MNHFAFQCKKYLTHMYILFGMRDKIRLELRNCQIVHLIAMELKAMKSSPLLGTFCGSEFWGFSLLKI